MTRLSKHKRNPVAISGFSLISSLGADINNSWHGLLRQKVGKKVLPARISDYVNSREACLVDGFNALGDEKLMNMALLASKQALSMSGISKLDCICIGSSSAGFASIEHQALCGNQVFESRMIPRSLVTGIAEHFDVQKKYQFSQACAASGSAIVAGVDLISSGKSKFILAGGADEVTAAVMAGFESCKIHSSVCRPFDVRRRGLVLGEAAAFIVLVDLNEALRLGLPIYALIGGTGLTSDAFSAASHNPQGDSIDRAIKQALGKIVATEIDFVCAHGTGTKSNDKIEALALTRVFNGNPPPVASYKGSFGHPQGASGACGVVLAIKSLNSQTLFPNVGLEKEDVSLSLDIVKEARHQAVRSVLCLSSGSWGVNCAIIVSYPDWLN